MEYEAVHKLSLKRRKGVKEMLTINPGDDHTLGEGQQHEGEGGTIPVHDLQNVDSTLQNRYHHQHQHPYHHAPLSSAQYIIYFRENTSVIYGYDHTHIFFVVFCIKYDTYKEPLKLFAWF